MELMFLERRDVFNNVDTATRSSSGPCLDSAEENYGPSVETIWEALENTWCSMYAGYSNRPKTDQGSKFIFDR